MNKVGKSQCDIAVALGVSQGTISKELKDELHNGSKKATVISELSTPDELPRANVRITDLIKDQPDE